MSLEYAVAGQDAVCMACSDTSSGIDSEGVWSNTSLTSL